MYQNLQVGKELNKTLKLKPKKYFTIIQVGTNEGRRKWADLLLKENQIQKIL